MQKKPLRVLGPYPNRKGFRLIVLELDKRKSFTAPTLDLQVTLHRLAPDEPWLLLEGTSPVAADGLIGFTSRVWSRDGRLLASGGGQTLCRRVPN